MPSPDGKDGQPDDGQKTGAGKPSPDRKHGQPEADQKIEAGKSSSDDLAPDSSLPAIKWLWERAQMLDSHSNGVCAVDFAPGGEVLATGSQDNAIRIWGRDLLKGTFAMRHVPSSRY